MSIATDAKVKELVILTAELNRRIGELEKAVAARPTYDFNGGAEQDIKKAARKWKKETSVL